MAGITAAGSASGMDFESIILASVQAKQASLNKQTTTKKEETNILLSGVGKLSGALESFQKAIKALTEDNGFNIRKVTTDQPTENPYFTIDTKDDAASGEYDIAVKQLASNEKIEKKFADDTKFGGGKLTITIPGIKNGETGKYEDPRELTIDIEDGSNLEQIRKQINNNDLGITASIVKTKDGDKLVIDSGVSGASVEEAGNFSIKVEGGDENLQSLAFDKNSANGWTHKEGQDAVIEVDGEEIRSSSNKFSGQLSGLTITVNRVSETEKGEDGAITYKTNHATIEQDNDAVAKKMQDFVSAYNALQDTMDSLYKHNTYTEGQNNYDGGEMAGDSMLRGLMNQLQQMMSSFGAKNEKNNLDIYSLGLEVDRDGKLKLDSTEFKEGLEDNFNAVVNLFSGDDGILTKVNNAVEEYTKSDGIIDSREEELNALIKQYEEKETANALYLEQYEAHLRQKYAKLDTTIAGYNTSLLYLQSALG